MVLCSLLCLWAAMLVWCHPRDSGSRRSSWLSELKGICVASGSVRMKWGSGRVWISVWMCPSCRLQEIHMLLHGAAPSAWPAAAAVCRMLQWWSCWAAVNKAFIRDLFCLCFYFVFHRKIIIIGTNNQLSCCLKWSITQNSLFKKPSKSIIKPFMINYLKILSSLLKTLETHYLKTQ